MDLPNPAHKHPGHIIHTSMTLNPQAQNLNSLSCSLSFVSLSPHFTHRRINNNSLYSVDFFEVFGFEKIHKNEKNARSLQEQLNRLEAISCSSPSHQRRRLPSRRCSRRRLSRDLARLSRLSRLALSAGTFKSLASLWFSSLVHIIFIKLWFFFFLFFWCDLLLRRFMETLTRGFLRLCGVELVLKACLVVGCSRLVSMVRFPSGIFST